jgi:hypothetical protein
MIWLILGVVRLLTQRDPDEVPNATVDERVGDLSHVGLVVVLRVVVADGDDHDVAELSQGRRLDDVETDAAGAHVRASRRDELGTEELESQVETVAEKVCASGTYVSASAIESPNIVTRALAGARSAA